MAKHSGGPAFPVQETHIDGAPKDLHFGMSLRDYFAAKAMQGGITTATGLGNVSGDELDRILATFCRVCYAIADAMLKERAK